MLRDNSGHDPGGEQVDFEIAKTVAAVHAARKKAIATAGTTRSTVEHMGRRTCAPPSAIRRFAALARYESFHRGIFTNIAPYCSDRTDPASTFPKVWPYPAKLLAMQRAAS